MRVLIVEDEPALAEMIAVQLTKAMMIPLIVGNGIHASAMLQQAKQNGRLYDAVVLDLTLPGMDGMDVLKKMRASADSTPVLILTARHTLDDRVGGLEKGADDFLAKPFESQELIARLRAITRRHAERSSEQSCGNLNYDIAAGLFTVDGAVLTLAPRLHAILHALFKRRGHPVSKEHLKNMDDEGTSDEAVDTQLHRLRKKLREAGADVAIKTHHMVGYSLDRADVASGV